jgi:hypothetical protein
LYLRNVNHRLPPWLVLVVLAATCAGVIGVVATLRINRTSTASLVERFPADAVLVYVDFRALKDAGILGFLSSSKVVQEPEYRAFVDQTGFDYMNDLESAFVSFHPGATYFLLRGKFDWKNLRDYTLRQGGSCYNTLCKVGGSTPDRKISYFPLQPGLMALAVSKDDTAAMDLQNRRPGLKFELPADPIWSLIPVGVLKNNAAVPAGTRTFARALEGADSVVFSAAPEGKQVALRMDATCRTPGAAVALAAQLREATARLRDLIARENQTPNAADLSGILAAGAFEPRENHVLGRWPVSRAFLERIAGSGL